MKELLVVACEILVPQPGTEPRILVVKVWSPNHQTTREFPGLDIFKMWVL